YTNLTNRLTHSFPTRRSSDLYANEQTALLSDSHYLRDAVNGRLSQHCTQLRQSDRTATADSPAHKACGHALWLHAYAANADFDRSEEHTSELQSRFDLVCRLL